MKTFKDSTGKEWQIDINVDAVKRVRSLVDVDLMDAVSGKLAIELADDPIRLVDTVYALCKPQADAAGITDDAFGRAMAGDAIDSATTALLEELVGFFPRHRRRVLEASLNRAKVLQSQAVEEALTAISRVTLSGVASGSAPGSSDVTQGDGPSAN